MLGFVSGGAVALGCEGLEGAAFAGSAAWGGSVHPGDVVFESAGEPARSFEPLELWIDASWFESGACDDLGAVELLLRSGEQIVQEGEHWPCDADALDSDVVEGGGWAGVAAGLELGMGGFQDVVIGRGRGVVVRQ